MLAIFVRRSLQNVLNTVKTSIFSYSYEPVRISRCISSLPADKHAFAISYLMNKPLGFTQEIATKLASTGKLNFQFPEKPDSVLSFFEKHGFSISQVCKIISGHPQILLSNPERTHLPKFEFFASKGLSSPGLVTLVSLNPKILTCSLVKQIIPFYNCFKTIVGSDDDVFRALRYSRWMLCKYYQSCALRNVAILREYGLPPSNINRLVIWYPSTLGTSCDQFTETVEEVKQLGFSPSQSVFIEAINVKRALSKATWEKKFNGYRKWGWSDKEILMAFSKQPRCMKYSEEKITATMDFFINTMGLESTVIARCPWLLSASLENRIIPRSLVLNALLSKGLPKKNFSLSTYFIATEKNFVKSYITCYENEASNLLKLYHERPNPATYKQKWNISLDGLMVKL